jgi:CRISPR-associated protein Csh1
LGEKWSGDFKEGKSMWNGKPVSKLNLAGMVGEFFYHREKDKKIFDKSSLNILGDILEAKQIDRGYFIKHLIEAIREEYGRNEWSEKLLSLKSLYLFDFLIELGLVLTFGKNLRFKGVKLMEETIIKDSKSVEDFFKEFQNAFDTPDKKAVFLEGVLVSFLLDVQYAKRKDTPFRKKLHGLRLNKRLIKRLFPEIIEKLRQYDAGYPWLETLISKYFIEADETDWIISDDEISYYFALGLNFGRIFKGGELGE